MAAPGPWTVAILTDGTVPTLFVAIDDAGFTTVPVTAATGGQFLGVVPPLPVGSVFRYYVEGGGETLPVGEPHAVEVVRARGAAADGGAAMCSVSFRAPLEGQRLRPEVDDSAPEDGLQFTVIVETDLPDGHPLRLDVGTVGYADVVGVGQVGFRNVTLPPGGVVLLS